MRFLGVIVLLLLFITSLVVIPYMPIPDSLKPFIYLFCTLFTFGMIILYFFTYPY